MTEAQAKALIRLLADIAHSLDRIAKALEDDLEGSDRDRAIQTWKDGLSRHPDD